MSNVSRRRLIIFFIVPASIFLIAYVVTIIPYLKYTRGIYEFLAFLLVADLAAALSGKWRDAAIIAATLVFGFATTELVCAAFESNAPITARGFAAARPVLGWGPSAPGVYHSSETAWGGVKIYDVDYTIDDHLLRRTVSAANGPTVAFFGDSMTFGQGLGDSQTLPQDFSNLNGGKLRVLNFGFPGYGPQQFLRAMETGIFDPLLANAKTFVFETAAWHAERASCLAGFMARAPRYELRNGKLVYSGACSEGLNRVLHDIFMNGAAYNRLIAPFANAVGPADIKIYLAELQRCAELVKQKYNGRLVIVYLAGNAKYLAKTGFTDAMIEARLRHAGMDVIDATLSPKDFPPGTLFKIPGDGHPTAIANRARAAMLQQFLTVARGGTSKSMDITLK
ncbi:MAG: SGNH/GDSL hydrolase family protein [Methylovirgula sp.]